MNLAWKFTTGTTKQGPNHERQTRRRDFAFVPNVGSPGGKLGPALIVQSDLNNTRLNETIIAAITINVSRVHEKSQLFIDISTPDGAASGLVHNSAIRCERLHSITQTDVRRVIGVLSDALMAKIDE